MTEDLITQYLAELRASLRTPPERTEEILAEAEDHLRESAAAGEAMGLTERDAQEAALAAFGRVRAVVRAHRRPAAAVLAEAGMAAMKLAASYLLAVPLAGLSGVLLQKAVIHAVAPPGSMVVLAPVDYARTVGVLAASAAAGMAFLACYRIARSGRVRGTRRPGGLTQGALLGGYFPLAAVICMFVVALFVIPLLSRTRFPGESLVSAPGMSFAAVFGAAGVALGYAVQMAWILLRQRDTGDAAGERVPHAG